MGRQQHVAFAYPLGLRHGKPDGVLTGYGSEILAVALSRDGSVLASASGDGRIHVFRLTPEISLLGSWTPHGERRLAKIALDPDARFAVTGGADGTARFLDLTRLEFTDLVVRLPADVSALVLSPDGTMVFAGDEAGQVHAIERATGALRWSTTVHRDGVIAIAADGATLATCGWDPRVQIACAATGGIRSTIRIQARLARGLAFGHRDKRLHILLDDGRLAYHDFIRGTTQAESQSHGIRAIAYCPDTLQYSPPTPPRHSTATMTTFTTQLDSHTIAPTR